MHSIKRIAWIGSNAKKILQNCSKFSQKFKLIGIGWSIHFIKFIKGKFVINERKSNQNVFCNQSAITLFVIMGNSLNESGMGEMIYLCI